MRLHRFYIDNPIEHQRETIKDEKLIHQWRDVFRFNVGSEIIIFDGSGKEFDAIIEKINNREVELKIFDEKDGVVPKSLQTGFGREIILCQSLVKKDKMEWIAEKATELGVSKIIPVISERSEKKSWNLERAQKIVIEASEQCGRADVPEISEVTSFEEILNECQSKNWQIIVFDPSGEKITPPATQSEDCEALRAGPPPNPLPQGEGANFSQPIRYSLPIMLQAGLPQGDETGPSQSYLAVFIGPEGGFSEKELEMFKENDAKIFSLGKLVLRAETAAVAALTTLVL